MAAVCPQCKSRGMIAKGQAVQYCMCPTGRQKKESWNELRKDMPAEVAEEEKLFPTLPDLDDLRGVA